MLSFPHFSAGLDKVSSVAQVVKEKLFALMDVQGIGLVVYDSFLETLQQSAASRPKVRVSDGFEWEEDLIRRLKAWIREGNLSAEEVFRTFDHDFDGAIDMGDVVHVLKLLGVDVGAVSSTKVERLYRLLDQYKTGSITQKDIEL